MARVRMLVDISGGRGDGTEWPRYGTVLECGHHEAARLIVGGHAEWADDDVQPAVTPPVTPPPAPEPPVAASAAVPGTVEVTEPENGSQDDEEPSDGSKPRVRDAKEVWEQHAITVHGVDVNAARSMTKADLIATYGNGS